MRFSLGIRAHLPRLLLPWNRLVWWLGSLKVKRGTDGSREEGEQGGRLTRESLARLPHPLRRPHRKPHVPVHNLHCRHCPDPPRCRIAPLGYYWPRGQPSRRREWGPGRGWAPRGWHEAHWRAPSDWAVLPLAPVPEPRDLRLTSERGTARPPHG